MKKFTKICIEFICTVIFMTIVVYIVLSQSEFGAYYNFDIGNILLFAAVLSIIMLLLMKGFISYLKKRRYLKSPLSKIDKMTGEEFEQYLKTRFEKQGYKVEMTPASNDFGADLICRNRHEIIAVQAKRYGANVGNAAIQEAVASREYYQADRCIVATNSYFTRNAVALAEANDVELWNRDIICKMI